MLDMIEALRSPGDESVFLQSESGADQYEIGAVLNLSPEDVANQLRRIRARANRCKPGCICKEGK